MVIKIYDHILYEKCIAWDWPQAFEEVKKRCFDLNPIFLSKNMTIDFDVKIDTVLKTIDITRRTK